MGPSLSPSCLTIEFSGPFSWPGAPDAPSLFESELKMQGGIYLWTVPLSDGHLVYYVGETGRSFEVRMLEHFREHAACRYALYSPPEFARGEKILLWPGRYNKSNRKSLAECVAQCPILASKIAEVTYLYRFFLAPLACDHRLRKRAEAEIARCLYAAPGVVGDFQDKGIRYDPRLPSEHHVRCTVSSSLPLMGMPVEVWA